MNNRAKRWTKIFIAIAVFVTLDIAGVVMYRTSVHTTRVTKAIAEIKAIQMEIDNYYEMYDDYPLALEDVGHNGRLDPWNNPYEFQGLKPALVPHGAPRNGKGLTRRPAPDSRCPPRF